MFKTIGILGGMGPEATLELFKLIIAATPAKSDQEHLPVLIYNNPAIPDRTLHIVYNQPTPLPLLIESGKVLEEGGAEMILIPCNTAHYFVPQLQPHLSIPILNMIELTAKYIATHSGGGAKVGILATTGTIQSKLYQKGLESVGLEWITVNSEDQESVVMEAIYGKEGVKAGYHDKGRELLKGAAAGLIAQGADYIIGGCTEIPLVLKQEMISVPLINSMDIVAREAVTIASNGKYIVNR